MSKLKTRDLTTLATLIALEVLLTRFLSIETPTVRIGFGFIPIMICGMLYGPWVAGGTYAIADLIGVMLFPKAGFFPGFTLSAFIIGFLYGLFFKKKPISIYRAIVCSLVVTICVHLFLNTYWLTIIVGKGWLGMSFERILKSIFMIPIQIFFILWLNKAEFMKKIR